MAVISGPGGRDKFGVDPARDFVVSWAMPQRDFILRLIEEAAQVLAKVVLNREAGQYDQAVYTVIDSMEKLFGLGVSELAALDADQLYAQLTREEHPETARDKCIVFAALNYQAGLAYEGKDLTALAQPAFHLSLVFTLPALTAYPGATLPPFTPRVEDLLYHLEGFALPDSTAELLEAYRSGAEPGAPRLFSRSPRLIIQSAARAGQVVTMSRVGLRP